MGDGDDETGGYGGAVGAAAGRDSRGEDSGAEEREGVCSEGG